MSFQTGNFQEDDKENRQENSIIQHRNVKDNLSMKSTACLEDTEKIGFNRTNRDSNRLPNVLRSNLAMNPRIICSNITSNIIERASQRSRNENIMSSNRTPGRASSVPKHRERSRNLLTVPRYAQQTESFSMKRTTQNRVNKKIYRGSSKIKFEPTKTMSPNLATSRRARSTDLPLNLKSKPKVVYTGKLTKPRSTKLHTESRCYTSRHKFKSQEQKEIEFMKGIKPFKASLINKKIMLSSGDLGVPKVSKRPLTTFQEFKFETARRASINTTKQMKSRKEEHQKGGFNVKYTRNPDLNKSVPFGRSLQRHNRAIQMLTQKENARKSQEVDIRNFVANPLPSFSHVFQPRKAPTVLTIAHTPKTLIRSRLSAEAYENKLRQEIAAKNELHNFKAMPFPMTTFTPQKLPFKSPKPPTIPETPILKSDIRAEDRKAFDAHIKQIECESKAERERQEKFSKIRLMQELKEYRKTLIHKARPMPYSSKAHK